MGFDGITVRREEGGNIWRFTFNDFCCKVPVSRKKVNGSRQKYKYYYLCLLKGAIKRMCFIMDIWCQMDKRISRQFFNNEAAHWDDTVRNNDPVKLQAIAEHLEFPQCARILDVGSGTGVFVPFILSKLNNNGRVVCVDFALSMLEIAQAKNQNRRIYHVCAEIETVGFAKGIFDAVVCYSTFPHFHEKALALRNINKILVENGVLFICHTASRECINGIHRRILGLEDHLIPQAEEMREMMIEAGFCEVTVLEETDFYLATGVKRKA